MKALIFNLLTLPLYILGKFIIPFITTHDIEIKVDQLSEITVECHKYENAVYSYKSLRYPNNCGIRILTALVRLDANSTHLSKVSFWNKLRMFKAVIHSTKTVRCTGNFARRKRPIESSLVSAPIMYGLNHNMKLQYNVSSKDKRTGFMLFIGRFLGFRAYAIWNNENTANFIFSFQRNI